MMNHNDEIYQELRENFIVIGLTGALGSGCTKSAEILSSAINIESLLPLREHQREFDALEPYRLNKIQNFLKTHQWKEFYHLKVSNLLFCIFFNHEDKYLDEEYQVKKWFKGNAEVYRATHQLCQKICAAILTPNGQESGQLSELLKQLNGCIQQHVVKTQSPYTQVFQKIGSELREQGLQAFINSTLLYQKKIASVFAIADFIKQTIKHLRKEGYKFFVLDALRNLYEINYFKARYSNFYLFSINASKTERKNRILSQFGHKLHDYELIEKNETNKDENHSQNINECIGNGDVFITNNLDIKDLQYQLVKYVSLIRRPGLFTPSKDERSMQIALTARYNSGCISRQVGACVVGKDGYVLGIGWNDVPEGSIPCLYRSSHSLLMDHKGSPEFSEYEISERFKHHVAATIGVNHQPFCFKDLENRRNGQEKLAAVMAKNQDENLSPKLQEALLKEFKNTTRERALHAEENAFLQSSKVGGGSLKHSILYTTASPCQLCAKKAMQLGVSRIVYIDAYPDISNAQTLQSGEKDKYPKLDMFVGVAESAFMKLYKPLINIKDEFYNV